MISLTSTPYFDIPESDSEDDQNLLFDRATRRHLLDNRSTRQRDETSRNFLICMGIFIFILIIIYSATAPRKANRCIPDLKAHGRNFRGSNLECNDPKNLGGVIIANTTTVAPVLASQTISKKASATRKKFKPRKSNYRFSYEDPLDDDSLDYLLMYDYGSVLPSFDEEVPPDSVVRLKMQLKSATNKSANEKKNNPSEGKTRLIGKLFSSDDKDEDSTNASHGLQENVEINAELLISTESPADLTNQSLVDNYTETLLGRDEMISKEFKPLMTDYNLMMLLRQVLGSMAEINSEENAGSKLAENVTSEGFSSKDFNSPILKPVWKKRIGLTESLNNSEISEQSLSHREFPNTTTSSSVLQDGKTTEVTDFQSNGSVDAFPVNSKPNLLENLIGIKDRQQLDGKLLKDDDKSLNENVTKLQQSLIALSDIGKLIDGFTDRINIKQSESDNNDHNIIKHKENSRADSSDNLNKIDSKNLDPVSLIGNTSVINIGTTDSSVRNIVIASRRPVTSASSELVDVENTVTTEASKIDNESSTNQISKTKSLENEDIQANIDSKEQSQIGSPRLEPENESSNITSGNAQERGENKDGELSKKSEDVDKKGKHKNDKRKQKNGSKINKKSGRRMKRESKVDNANLPKRRNWRLKSLNSVHFVNEENADLQSKQNVVKMRKREAFINSGRCLLSPTKPPPNTRRPQLGAISDSDREKEKYQTRKPILNAQKALLSKISDKNKTQNEKNNYIPIRSRRAVRSSPLGEMFALSDNEKFSESFDDDFDDDDKEEMRSGLKLQDLDLLSRVYQDRSLNQMKIKRLSENSFNIKPYLNTWKEDVSHQSNRQKKQKNRRRNFEGKVEEIDTHRIIRGSDSAAGKHNTTTQAPQDDKAKALDRKVDRRVLLDLLRLTMSEAEMAERRKAVPEFDKVVTELGGDSESRPQSIRVSVGLSQENRSFIITVVMLLVFISISVLMFSIIWCLYDLEFLFPKGCPECCYKLKLFRTPDESFSPQQWWMDSLSRRMEKLEQKSKGKRGTVTATNEFVGD